MTFCSGGFQILLDLHACGSHLRAHKSHCLCMNDVFSFIIIPQFTNLILKQLYYCVSAFVSPVRTSCQHWVAVAQTRWTWRHRDGFDLGKSLRRLWFFAEWSRATGRGCHRNYSRQKKRAAEQMKEGKDVHLMPKHLSQILISWIYLSVLLMSIHTHTHTRIRKICVKIHKSVYDFS